MKDKINILCFISIIFIFFICILFKEDSLISTEERRYLAQRDDLRLDSQFSENYEEYLLDQFPLRSKFRKIKSITAFNIFNKKENNDIIIYNDSAIKITKDYNYEGVNITIDKINFLQNKLFKNNKVYFALIPDKSCFYDKFDVGTNYLKIEEIAKQNLNNKISYIAIKDELSLDMYYKTDSHWSQDKIINVANKILLNLNGTQNNENFTIKSINNFEGVYLSQACLPLEKDTINYLENNIINDAKVYNFETNKETKIYDLDKLNDEKSLDNYDIFLSGAAPLLKITNEKSQNDKTLIIFRDSYSSSLAPLLINNYKTIYLVDLRYIDSDLISKFIKIKGDEDVLFIYSTLIINTPNNFKINN